ncbi:NAD(P)H-binding protein [Nocardioides sp. QY071]|uniref:NAD(P)H-binding protein n=1 Tax=Nocardioides sp. QY071 TaxID=3044187 RepID=UPI00249B0F18|nr:NAD(P)H-binding protein [Nocardioides sp. QY071]WGY00464.1 NAD(P)H-binding protein [Nocardioides sp. QY071]
MSREIWVLGATGRIGREIVELLHESGGDVVAVGRDRARLRRVHPRTRVLAGTLDEISERLGGDSPAVVVNTVGPFKVTAPRVAAACSPATHYVDISNDLDVFERLDGMHQDAASTGRTLVYGAGFGVLGTEAALLPLLADQERPSSVRVDAIASIASEPGRLGESLAATVVDQLRHGGREVRADKIVRTWTGGSAAPLTTPDGDVVTTASQGGGDLFAAWRASGASEVIAATPLAPGNPLARTTVAAIGGLLQVPGMASLTTRGMARINLKTARERPRESSWARARVEWPDGRVREGWLRAGEGMAFTARVAAEVATRLTDGRGRPGAFSPGRIFGPELALAAGAELLNPGAS